MTVPVSIAKLNEIRALAKHSLSEIQALVGVSHGATAAPERIIGTVNDLLEADAKRNEALRSDSYGGE